MRTDFLINWDSQSDREEYEAYCKEQRGWSIISHQDKTKQRSISLNNYYHGVVIAYIADYTGRDGYYWHCWFRGKFIPHIIFVDDMDLTSTTNANQEDMWTYCEMIRTWAHLNFRVTKDSTSRRVFTIPDPTSVIRPFIDVKYIQKIWLERQPPVEPDENYDC